MPIYDTGSGCDIAEGEKAKSILDDFNVRNAELADGRWIDGWDKFCHWDGLAPYKDIALGKYKEQNAEERFAHYLDCEAHTDV